MDSDTLSELSSPIVDPFASPLLENKEQEACKKVRISRQQVNLKRSLLILYQCRKRKFDEVDKTSGLEQRTDRTKWLDEYIFAKYWKKPTKKNGVLEEDPNNPPRDTMTKLWPCKIGIENHVYEVNMYAVRGSRPLYQPVMQYGPLLAKSLDFGMIDRKISVDGNSRMKSNVRRTRATASEALPDISAVVFDFTDGSGDRFRFPEYSILEFQEGYIIAFFLIVRRGTAGETYDPKLDYYQPVTIRLSTDPRGRINLLSKVVAPPDEVQRYMDDIMKNMKRAEYVLLSMQLSMQQITLSTDVSSSNISNDDGRLLSINFACPYY
jgi:hypothetical protein